VQFQATKMINGQYGVTYDVNGIIKDGNHKYDKHIWKCYHCQQQM
jgi:hypothetical protein